MDNLPLPLIDTAQATRAYALHRMANFAPRMGRRYASGRNYDHGAGRHTAVSALSPHVRHRLITEAELVETALAHHGLAGAEKFIQEVFWRTYFKGWLERRPAIWDSYRDGVMQDLWALDDDRRLRKQYAAAVEGATGLACFDAWVQELVETGYLHNHARMWFASIWVFTLRLPWRLGADFFLRHLLDGDPASNTLGWRWIAGLHTVGKTYRAEAWNIAKFTQGRFQPRPHDLSAVADALTAEEPDGLPEATPVRAPRAPKPDVPSLLLITSEDGCPADLAALSPDTDIRAVATLSAAHLRGPELTSDLCQHFEANALADAATRTAEALDVPMAGALAARDAGDVVRLAQTIGAKQIITPFVTRGPLFDWMGTAADRLAAQGVHLGEWQRAWDRNTWPLATAGFFKVKKQIPRLLEVLLPHR